MIDIKGSIRVKQRNTRSSDIQYAVLFLEDRLLFVKVGGQLTSQSIGGCIGILVGGVVLFRYGFLWGLVGIFVGGFTGAIIGKNFYNNKKTLHGETVEEILQSNKKNFQVLYKDIVGMEVDTTKPLVASFNPGTLVVESENRMKFDLMSSRDLDEGRILISSLIIPQIQHK